MSIFTRGDFLHDVMCDTPTNCDDVASHVPSLNAKRSSSADSSPNLCNRPQRTDADQQATTSTLAMSRRQDPIRPSTLTRPVQLPSCCNFRKQPWRVYVHGDFSYHSMPRFYNGVDGEIGSAKNNEDLVKIIEELGRSISSNNSGKPQNVSGCCDVIRPDAQVLGPRSISCDDKIPTNCPTMIGTGSLPVLQTDSSLKQEDLVENGCHNDQSVSRQNVSQHLDKKVIGRCDGVVETVREKRLAAVFDVGSQSTESVTNCTINNSQNKETGGRHSTGLTTSSFHSVQCDTQTSDQQLDLNSSLSTTETVTPSTPPHGPAASVQSEKLLESSAEVRSKRFSDERTESPPARRQLKSRRSRNRSLQRAADETPKSPPGSKANAGTGCNRRSRTLSPTQTDNHAPASRQGSSTSPLKDNGPSKTSGCQPSSDRVQLSHTISLPRRQRQHKELCRTRCSQHGGETSPSRHCHATSSLPAIDENELPSTASVRSASSARQPEPAGIGFWLDVDEAGHVVAKNQMTSCQQQQQRKSLLDVMHKKFYPGQYQYDDISGNNAARTTRSAEQLNVGDVMTSAESSVGSCSLRSADSSSSADSGHSKTSSLTADGCDVIGRIVAVSKTPVGDTSLNLGAVDGTSHSSEPLTGQWYCYVFHKRYS